MGFPLENYHVFSMEIAPPASGGGGGGGRGGGCSGGVAFSEEIVGGGANFGDVIELGVFGEGATEARERVAARVGGRRGGKVGSGFVLGG